MKVGVWIPCYRSWVRAEEVRRLATMAEELAFDSLWVQDHLVAPVGSLARTRVEPMYKNLDGAGAAVPDLSAVDYYGAENWWLDPYVLWGFLAGCTSRVQLGSSIIVLPYRDPVVQAKMLGTLDVLSSGRMIFGVGVGHVEAEFAALGVPFAERGARSDEYLRLIRAFVQGNELSFEGAFAHLPEVRPLIRSVQRPYPPVFVGGNSRRAVRRAVELGDAWFPTEIEPDVLADGMGYLRQVADTSGTPVPEVAVALVWGLEDPRLSYTGPRTRAYYSVPQAAGLLSEYARLGVTHLAIDLPNPNVSVLVRQLELLSEAVAHRDC